MHINNINVIFPRDVGMRNIHQNVKINIAESFSRLLSCGDLSHGLKQIM